MEKDHILNEDSGIEHVEDSYMSVGLGLDIKLPKHMVKSRHKSAATSRPAPNRSRYNPYYKQSAFDQKQTLAKTMSNFTNNLNLV